MKILEISPYATCNDVPLLSQCKSGFGYMTYDIAHALAKEAEVDELLYNYRYHEFTQGGIRFVANTFKHHLNNIFKCCNPFIPLKLWWKYRMQPRTFIRLVYVWLISGHFYDVIKKGKYDIVHIHGCQIYDEILINVCHRLNQKFVITLHGLDSFSDSVKLEPAGKKYERYLLQRVINGDFPITVISSGIKNIVLKEYNAERCDGINVICNAFSFSEDKHETSFNIRKEYGIEQDALVLLYVGNLCYRKNQKQVIDAFPYLSEELRKKIYVLFLGRDIEPDYAFKEYVDNSAYKERFIVCGNVDKEFVHFYYQQANGVVLLSISEGFGLSIIEGMHFGLPCLTFEDLDAYEDIYNERSVVGIGIRDNLSVAKGLEKLITAKWDKESIIEHSRKFESSAMAHNYIKLFNQIIYKL